LKKPQEIPQPLHSSRNPGSTANYRKIKFFPLLSLPLYKIVIDAQILQRNHQKQPISMDLAELAGICRRGPTGARREISSAAVGLELPRGARCAVTALAIARCRYSRRKADRRRPWGNLGVPAAALHWISTEEKGNRTVSFWVHHAMSFRDWTRLGEPKLTVREGGAEGRQG
jgi:hypothetical protein